MHSDQIFGNGFVAAASARSMDSPPVQECHTLTGLRPLSMLLLYPARCRSATPSVTAASHQHPQQRHGPAASTSLMHCVLPLTS